MEDGLDRSSPFLPWKEKREWPGVSPLGRRAQEREGWLGVKACLLGRSGFLRFPARRIRPGGFVGAYRSALRLIEEPDPFLAPLWIDFMIIIPHADRLVAPFRFAHSAAQALFRNSVRHVSRPPIKMKRIAFRAAVIFYRRRIPTLVAVDPARGSASSADGGCTL